MIRAGFLLISGGLAALAAGPIASQSSGDAALEAQCRSTEVTAPNSCPCTITRAREVGLSDAEMMSLFTDDGHSQPVEQANYTRFWQVKTECIMNATMARMGISQDNPLPGVPEHMRPGMPLPGSAPAAPERRDLQASAPAQQRIPVPPTASSGGQAIAPVATSSTRTVSSEIGPDFVETTTALVNSDFTFSYSKPIDGEPALLAMAKASADKALEQMKEYDQPSGASYRNTENLTWSTYGSLGRLWTVSVTGYTNNRPQAQFVDALLWDAELDREIAWTNVFDKGLWNGRIRRDYCSALQAERRERGTQQNTFCPEFDKLLIDFERGDDGSVSMSFAALAYIAGSYAEGPYDITMPLDATLLAGVKEPYRELLDATGPASRDAIAIRDRLGSLDSVLAGDIQANDDYYLLPPGKLPLNSVSAFRRVLSEDNPALFMTLWEGHDQMNWGYSIRLDGETHNLSLADTRPETRVMIYSDGEISVQIAQGDVVTDNPAFGYRVDDVTITKGGQSETFKAINFGGA